MPPMQQLGPYQLVDRLAVGGMAEIYVARSRGVQGFQKDYVLKLIHPKYIGDAEFIRMLVDEAKLVSKLQHSNIAQVIDLGMDGEAYYILMEYVRGKDLYQILQTAWDEDLQLPIPMCLHIAMDMCAGLYYAHTKVDDDGRPLNIVHRDISPQNVLVSFQGEGKILDFGVAKAALGARPETRAGIIKGKFRYMSPEQAWGEKLDGRSDLFSVGLCLYEMLTGTTAYEDDGNMQKTLQRMRDATFTPPSKYRPEIDPKLEGIVMKSLAREKHERYITCHAFECAIAEYLHLHYAGFTRTEIVPIMSRLFPEDTRLVHVPDPTEQTIAGVESRASTGELEELDLGDIEEVAQTNDVTIRQSVLRGPAPTEPPDDSFADEQTELYHHDDEPTSLELPSARGAQGKGDPMLATSDMSPDHLADLLSDESTDTLDRRPRVEQPPRMAQRQPFVTPGPDQLEMHQRATQHRADVEHRPDARRDTVAGLIEKYLPPAASDRALNLHHRVIELLESERGRRILPPLIGALLGMFVLLIVLIIML